MFHQKITILSSATPQSSHTDENYEKEKIAFIELDNIEFCKESRHLILPLLPLSSYGNPNPKFMEPMTIKMTPKKASNVCKCEKLHKNF